MIDKINADFLQNNLELWQYLSESEKQLLLDNTSLIKYNQGQIIYNGNTECIGVILVKTGKIRTYIVSENGKEVTLFRLHNNSVCILSASCIIKSISFNVCITAESDTQVLLINAKVFSDIVSKNIYAENFMHKSATERFSDVMWVFEQILFMSFDKRLAIFILEEVKKSDEITIKLTHDEIAKIVGSAREVVSRMLKYFESEKIVELKRGQIKVINKDKLQKLIN